MIDGLGGDEGKVVVAEVKCLQGRLKAPEGIVSDAPQVRVMQVKFLDLGILESIVIDMSEWIASQ